MNGFDFLLLGILTLAGGVVLIVKGRRRSSRRNPPFARQQVVRHAHNTAGARWLTVGVVAFILAFTRGRDTMFLVEHWENVLMPLTVLTVAWVITSAKADRAARLTVQARRFTIARAGRTHERQAQEPSRSGLSHVMQCPHESFWKGWQDPRKRPDS
jgi:hypothetical protein